MPQNYYLDTCIWRDYLENRSDRFRPLGDWALSLIKKIIKGVDVIIYSDLTEEELSISLSGEEIQKMLSIIPKPLLIRIEFSEEQSKEAMRLSKKLRIPTKDVLHAIIARDNNAILVTRDKHFSDFMGDITIKKPEELI